jgi:hypothetical protein
MEGGINVYLSHADLSWSARLSQEHEYVKKKKRKRKKRIKRKEKREKGKGKREKREEKREKRKGERKKKRKDIIIIMITPLGPWAVRSIYLHVFLHGVWLRVYS